MRVVVLHNAVHADSGPDEEDVLVQADAVCVALSGLGHLATRLSCTLDLRALKSMLEEERPDAVFNLVESIEGDGRLIHFVPGLLETMGLPFTGNPAEAFFLTSHKVLAKELLHGAGLPTPAWSGAASRGGEAPGGGRYIIKSIWEDASLGLDDDALVDCSEEALAGFLLAREGEPGAPFFAETFIEGREINLSLLGDVEGGVKVLPPAEILFSGYPTGKPRIVGYRAKWAPDSFEYMNTPRTFSFSDSDEPLLERLSELAVRAWNLLKMRGYGRVDFRVDGDGRPWILEANANPCLSPDAGFTAALDRAGHSYEEGIARILAGALAGVDGRT
jgi:D-alanine-D-alanine ligase